MGMLPGTDENASAQEQGTLLSMAFLWLALSLQPASRQGLGLLVVMDSYMRATCPLPPIYEYTHLDLLDGTRYPQEVEHTNNEKQIPSVNPSPHLLRKVPC